MNKVPKVSVVMITYGHEDYIRQAIEGVLMQECDFEVELIVANDCSPDNTDAVIQDILNSLPKAHWIKYIPHRENKGMMPNFIFALQQCQGKYIALCEGDDYWTDSLKLQKQVDFLEKNPDYVLCFHQVNILKTNGEIVDDFITIVPENYETIETLARLGNYIHTPSVVFRNIIKEFPVEFEQSPSGDYFLYMLLAEQGKIKYLEEKMAVYRDGVGVWSAKSTYYRNLNTALVHALLISFFSRKENTLIVSIFLKRIVFFLDEFEFKIRKNDLFNLSFHVLVKEAIYSWLLEKNAIFKSNAVQEKTSIQLMKIVFVRLKKRIWKM